MKAHLKIQIDRLTAVVQNINALTSREVLVGVPETEAPRDEAGPINNAALAYIHENGSPAQNIPARPFLVPGITENKAKISKRLQKAADEAMKGKSGNVLPALEAVGLTAQAAVRDKITNGDFAPLSPRTLAARARKGRNAEEAQPLIDTGQLRQSINYVIKNR